VEHVDTPRNNETVGREVDVSGWAVDDAGVRGGADLRRMVR